MSESFSRVLYPFEMARRPGLEPEVRRAILSRWSSNPKADAALQSETGRKRTLAQGVEGSKTTP